MHKPHAREMRKRAEQVQDMQNNAYLTGIKDACWEEIQRRSNEGYCSISFVVSPALYGRTIQFASLKLMLEREMGDRGYTVEIAERADGEMLVGVCW